VSVYPVRLQEWFPPKDEKRSNALLVLKYGECARCGKKNMDPRYAWIYHSAPYGFCTDHMWCSTRCLNAPEKVKEEV
jgi:hypothetical protein